MFHQTIKLWLENILVLELVLDTVDIEGVESGGSSKEACGPLSWGSLPTATKLPLKRAWDGFQDVM